MNLTKDQLLAEYKLNTDSVDLGDGRSVEIHEVPLTYISEMLQLAESDQIKMAEFAALHGCDLFESDPALLTKLKPAVITKIGLKVVEITRPFEEEIKNSESSQA
jgi:superfamily II RNA helicase